MTGDFASADARTPAGFTRAFPLLCCALRQVVVEGANRQSHSLGDTTMIILGILLCVAAIGILCWLLFTLAIVALPLFVGINASTWAFNTGAGWPGAILVGILAAGFTLGIGQILLGVIRPMWAKLAIAMVFVAPAMVPGYHATHGIAKHMMPSEIWQIVFSVIGAIAVGAMAYLRVAGIAAADQSGRDMVQA